MPKYFVRENMSLDKETEHHLKRVLRIRVGDKLTLCDGNGYDYHAIVDSLEPLSFEITAKEECKTELDYKITLYQALPKSDKLEWVIQKAVELGVYSIVPVLTEHCDVRPNSKKLPRYQKIAEAAAGQGMRGIVPQINEAITFERAIELVRNKNCDDCTMITAHEKASTSIKSTIVNCKPKEIGLWVGPEGGFSSNEIDVMEQNGFKIVSLGKRILRTETAAITAMAMIQAVME